MVELGGTDLRPSDSCLLRGYRRRSGCVFECPQFPPVTRNGLHLTPFCRPVRPLAAPAEGASWLGLPMKPALQGFGGPGGHAGAEEVIVVRPDPRVQGKGACHHRPVPGIA